MIRITEECTVALTLLACPSRCILETRRMHLSVGRGTLIVRRHFKKKQPIGKHSGSSFAAISGSRTAECFMVRMSPTNPGPDHVALRHD